MTLKTDFRRLPQMQLPLDFRHAGGLTNSGRRDGAGSLAEVAFSSLHSRLPAPSANPQKSAIVSGGSLAEVACGGLPHTPYIPLRGEMGSVDPPPPGDDVQGARPHAQQENRHADTARAGRQSARPGQEPTSQGPQQVGAEAVAKEAGDCVGRAKRPAIAAGPFSRRVDRASAFAAWVEADRPWPPPAGLLSALLSACMPRSQPRKFR